MRPKALVAVSAIVIALIITSLACTAGFIVGRASNQASGLQNPLGLSSSVPTQEQNCVNLPNTTVILPTPLPGITISPAPQAGVNNLFKPFWEAWNIVHQEYVDQPVDDLKLMQGAIRGMMDALGDKHSSYMDPDQYLQANMPMEQEYEGIGAWVDATGDYLAIVSPMPDSPAEKAGLKNGDIVLKIDGEDMTGIDGNLVIRRILGPAGSKVVLTIQREGMDAPFDVEITRAKITIASVFGKMLDNKVAYLQITQFADNTDQELRDTLQPLLDQEPVGLIIDLRNDGGGYLKTAIEVGSEFIDQGVLLQEVYGDGKVQTYQSLGNGIATQIPIVVLVNEGTASASEIVAGAIQDYGRGQLVGVTTYGKGSVQNWVPLQNDQGAVRVTIARWETPQGRQINEIGLKPDVEVPLSDEDLQAGRDPQLDKAVELILKK